MNRDEEWKLDGLCNEIGGELWYPESDSKAAREVCARCPVRQQCLDYALANGEQEGIWGGTSANQRRHMPGWTPKERGYGDAWRAA